MRKIHGKLTTKDFFNAIDPFAAGSDWRIMHRRSRTGQGMLNQLAGKLGLASLIGLGIGIPISSAESRHRSTIGPGIYGNVREFPQTGDLGGIEIEIGPSKQVETTLCEGWCNSTYRSTYRDVGGSIFYNIREELRDQDGRISINMIAVELKPSGKRVLAKVEDYAGWSVLKRLARPFGLEIARDSGHR